MTNSITESCEYWGAVFWARPTPKAQGGTEPSTALGLGRQCWLILDNYLKQNEAQSACAESTNKGINPRSKHVTQTKTWAAYGKSHLVSIFWECPLVGFLYLVFTRMPGESYHRRLRSLVLSWFDVFWALINSLVCWFWIFAHHLGGYSKMRYKKQVIHVESHSSAVSLLESGE